MTVALVTGAARRIGLGIAERLAEAGFAVALHASPASAAEAEREAARIGQTHGVPTGIVTADLAAPDAGSRVVKAAAAALGPVTLLVNSASLFEPDEATAPHALERHLSVNLAAPLRLAAAFAEALPAGQEGAVVNILDQRVLRPGPDYFSYTLSKAALATATQTLAEAFAPRRIRVNAVAPGPVLPNRHEGEAGFEAEVAALPLGRAVLPDEIADAVLFLARARSVTGQILAVDAGQHLGRTNGAGRAGDRP